MKIIENGWQMAGDPKMIGKSMNIYKWRLSIPMFHYQMLLPSPVPRQSGFVQKLCMISPKWQF